MPFGRRRARRRRGLTAALRTYTDPVQHALIAAAVTAPLVPLAGRRVLGTAVAVSTLIDADHIVAARSPRVRHTTSLAERPQTHSLLTAAATGATVTASPGRGTAGGVRRPRLASAARRR